MHHFRRPVGGGNVQRGLHFNISVPRCGLGVAGSDFLSVGFPLCHGSSLMSEKSNQNCIMFSEMVLGIIRSLKSSSIM